MINKNKPETSHHFIIEKSIPIPSGFRNSVIEALKAMEIGDSFVCGMNGRINLSTNARKLKRKFKSRAISGSEVRIWRIK